MAQISARTATWAKWAVVPVALLVSGVAVSQASYSAFSATTENTANNWTAGTVALTDDSAKTAMFTAVDLKPGSTGTKCITVTSPGSLVSTVKLYATNLTTPPAPKDLSPYINLTITQGTGGGFGSCEGFTPQKDVVAYTGTVAALGKSVTGFGTGILPWESSPKTSETRTYKIDYTLAAATPNTAQGGTASVGFTWEAQNNN